MGGLTHKIEELRKQRRAVILAHNYTLPEVQELADFVGDSLDLAFRGAAVRADVIVFCGVRFMAEMVKILNPSAKVLMPDTRAGCPMADMVTPEDLLAAKAKHPGCVVVCYVNSSAAVKALADICCTSANATKVLATIPPEREILFVPDRNLGAFAAEKAGRRVTCWKGFCPTHERILPEHVAEARKVHPDAVVVAHPECTAAVRSMADHVASTSGMLAYCRNSQGQAYIIATEEGLLHRLRRENPTKEFFPASPHMLCPNMKRTTAEKILWCLEELSGEIVVDPEVAARARQTLERMLAIAPPASRPKAEQATMQERVA